MTIDSVDKLTCQVGDAILNNTATGRKPQVVMASIDAAGHTYPLLKIAAGLIARSFSVTYVTGPDFRDAALKTGADYVASGAFVTDEFMAVRATVPVGPPRLVYDMEKAFIGGIPDQWTGLKGALELVRATHPDDDVVIVADTFFLGRLPLMFGAELPRGYTARPRVLTACTAPCCYASDMTGPFGPGLPPGDSAACVARNKLISQMMAMGPFASVGGLLKKMLASLGANDDLNMSKDPFSDWYTAADTVLQLCPPAVEYNMPDLPSHVKLIGCAPVKPLPADLVYPEWWEDDVVKGDKKIIMLSQGTMSHDYADLVIPTLEALANQADILVIALLGKRGASLPAHVKIPTNARVLDYFSYDAVLAHSSVAVLNAGYGGLLHAVTNGVPMVLAGATEDKPEVAMRAQVLGLGLNLLTGTPQAAQVREAVDKILVDDSYRQKCLAVRKENEDLNYLDAVVENLVAASK